MDTGSNHYRDNTIKSINVGRMSADTLGYMAKEEKMPLIKAIAKVNLYIRKTFGMVRYLRTWDMPCENRKSIITNYFNKEVR